MKNRIKDLLTVVFFGGTLLGFGLVSLLTPSREYSLSERRTLAQLPTATGDTLKSGSYMTDFESWSLDQFPLRDGFRSVKAVTARYLLGKGDDNGYYLCKGYLSKLEYPLNENRVERNANKLAEVYQSQIAASDCKVYLSLIPDKNAFLAPLGGYPALDYPAMVSDIRQRLSFAAYIDLFDTVELEDFYTTDQHWRQECILDTAQTLAAGLGSAPCGEVTVQTVEKPFYGTYYGQAALPVQPDTIRYLTNETIEGCTVTSYNTGKAKPAAMYDMVKAAGRDPYELFLSGSDALLVVENPNADTDRELVVFRDSFGSSLVPLLTEGYRKITLVDLRYLRSDLLPSFITFTDQDVLFLYSTLLFNNSLTQ